MPDAVLAMCGSIQQGPFISPLCLTSPKYNERKNQFHYTMCQKVPGGNGQIEGIEEPYPWYSWLSGVTQGQMYLVIQSPCLWYLCDIFITIDIFSEKSSILLWIGQYQISQR